LLAFCGGVSDNAMAQLATLTSRAPVKAHCKCIMVDGSLKKVDVQICDVALSCYVGFCQLEITAVTHQILFQHSAELLPAHLQPKYSCLRMVQLVRTLALIEGDGRFAGKPPRFRPVQQHLRAEDTVPLHPISSSTRSTLCAGNPATSPVGD
jgi:hypothetical protein